jgi:hypothetical protein
MTCAARLATAIVRRWVRVYTAGLEPAVRSERRAEMESDLWENEQDPTSGLPAGAEIMLRSLLGVPADISWRLEQANFADRLVSIVTGIVSVAERVSSWVTRTGLPGLGTILTWLCIAGGAVLIALAPFQAQAGPGFALIGGWSLLAGLAIRWGRARLDHRPISGFIAVLAGAGPLGVILMATLIAPVLSTIVVLSEGRRAWLVRRNSRRERLVSASL